MQPPENADQENLNKWFTLAIQDCDRRISILENAPKIRQTNGMNTARQGHWYTSIGIWLCIFLVIVGAYMIFLLYRQSIGYHIILPEFMR
jgi:hypothetical protein